MIRVLTGSRFFPFSKALMASRSAKVPKIVFFLLISSPQESKKFIVVEFDSFEASHRSMIWLRARL